MKAKTTTKTDRETRKAVRTIVSAMDKIIEAAKQAERAREILLAGNDANKGMGGQTHE